MMVEQQNTSCSPVKDVNGSTSTTKAATDAASDNHVPKPSNSEAQNASASIIRESANGTMPPPSTPATTAAKSLAPTTPIPRELTQFAPLLVGKYYIQDKRAVWAGRWGMTEAAFGENGVTSEFEMKSQEDVFIRTCSGPSDVAHPAIMGDAMSRSLRCENASVSEVSPVYLGYETDPAVRSAMPFDNKYSGYFQIQAVKGKPQTVVEKDVEIRFVHDASRPSQFIVNGSGENRFGVFTLLGTLDKETNEMRLYKLYKPKEKEKRTLPRRGRTPRVTSQANGVAIQAKPVPSQAPVPAAVVTPPASMHVAEPVVSVASRKVSTPVPNYIPPSLASRGRSERKRVIPAHLREENLIEYERFPLSIKKCHSILKSLLANPKAGPFLVPVDPIALGIPDYFSVIKEPMDLGTIRQNLETGYYVDPSLFADHVRLVFRNAMLYNAAHSQVHIFAQKLMEDFEKRIKTLNLKASAKEKNFQSKATAMKKERKSESSLSSKKVKGGKGAKGNSKRRVSGDDQGLIMSLKEDIERLKATLEQLQPSTVKIVTPRPTKAASRPFKMEDLTEEELNEPMTQMEKARLSSDIKSLPQDKINRVLQIIAEAVPVSKLANENDEVELDINAFDTRCLRMLEGYVRENGIGRKRKRPTQKSKVPAPVNRLKAAKVAALNIRYRQEELMNQLAAIDGELPTGANEKRIEPSASVTDVDDSMDVDEGTTTEVEKKDHSSSESSSSSSDSSDSESESDSESDSDGGQPLQRSPSLMSTPALSQISESAARADASKTIRDEAPNGEPLKVENRGAWSLLAKKDAPNGKSLIQSEANQSSSLWLSARSMEQIKQQKIQQKEKERNEELEAQRRRDIEQREKEKEREREELERRNLEQQGVLRQAEEDRLREERRREAERVRAAQRAAEREKLTREDDIDHNEHRLTEDLESFSSSSFL